jgi:regulatory LuxR family protein
MCWVLRTARLAAEGRTNREIAEALFITANTVADHLGAAYGRLGITPRSDLAVGSTPVAPSSVGVAVATSLPLGSPGAGSRHAAWRRSACMSAAEPPRTGQRLRAVASRLEYCTARAYRCG